MLPYSKNYAVYPSVFPENKESLVTITAQGNAFLFLEGEEYVVTVIEKDGDVPDYYTPSHKKLRVKAEGGVLRFLCTFSKEGEYQIVLEDKEKKLDDFFVYALSEDLYSLRPLKGDLHVHSYRSDGKIDPALWVSHYRSEGFDFFSLTDHNRFYPGYEIDETFSDINTGFTRISGEEVHAPDCSIHIVHNGGKASVAKIYWEEKERYDKEIAECFKRVPESIPEKYKDRYARVMWVCENIHKEGGLATFPHPFWKPGRSNMHNVCEEFTRILLNSGMFDAFELLGGNAEPEANCAVALWNDMRAEGLSIPVVSSSDVHSIGIPNQFYSRQFTIVFAKENESGAIMSSIKKGLSVAVEAVNYDYSRTYRCHGKLRLVSYVRFLLKTYFPAQQRILEGQADALKRYALGDRSGAAVIEGVNIAAEDNFLRFFGKKEPFLPTSEIIEREEKWRDVQRKGPSTKGSKIYGLESSMQI